MKCLVVSLCLLVFLNVDAKEFEKVKVTAGNTDFLNLKDIITDSFSEKFLKSNNILHSEEVLQFSPNVNFAGGSNRIRYIQIRGIGERSEYDSTPSTSVGFYYDHMDLSGIGGISTSFDTKKLEILKGSQSYLYGDSSIAGNILIESSLPRQQKTDLNLRIGSQNQKALSAQKNFSITENISLKIGAEKNLSNGFYKNSFTNKHSSSRDETFINFGSTVHINNVKVDSRHIFADFKNGYDVWNAYSNDFKTFTDNPGSDDQKALGHSVQVSVPFKSHHHLEILASHIDSESFYSYDEDWGNNSFWNNLSGYNDDYDYSKSYSRKNKNQHIKAIYQLKNKKQNLNLGTHIYRRNVISKIDSFKDSNLRSSLNSDYNSKHHAFFTSYNFKFNKRLSLNLGARLERQKIDYKDSESFKDTTSSNLSSQNLELLYKKNNKNTFKFIVSKGFTGAGINPDLNLTKAQQSYDPETALNFEFSWSRASTWFDHKINVFYTKRNNQQIKTSVQNNPLDPSEFTIYTDNASRSENYGLELSGLIAPLSKVNVGMSLGLLKARFISYEREGVSYDGRDLAHAPNYHLTTNLNYNVSNKIKLTLSNTTKDSFYYSNSHNQKSKPYSLFNANMSFKASKKLSISVFVKNIFNKNYAIRGFYFPNRPPNWDTELFTQRGAPLEWGIQMNLAL